MISAEVAELRDETRRELDAEMDAIKAKVEDNRRP